MLQLTVPEPSGVLFETTLEPHSPSVEKLRKRSSVDEGEIRTLRGKKNKVAVGVPYFENLISRLKALDEELPYEVKKMMFDYDFHYVRLTCSFLPDIDCRFEWAGFGVHLKSKGSEIAKIKPIACDIIKISFTPELKSNLLSDFIDAGIEGEISESKEYVVYEPQITSFGLGRPNVIWEFIKTREKGIFGNRSLLLIIRVPKRCSVKGTFLIGAEVASRLSRWVHFPVKNSDERVVNVEYQLSE